MPRVLLLLVLASLVACGAADSPEMQVRKVIGDIETAAEARNTSDVMAFVSRDFRDANGQGSDQLRRYLQGYFVTHASVHLLTRIDRIRFPADDEARLDVSVGSMNRGSSADWSLAADVRDLSVTLRREGGDWKVVFVDMNR